MIARTALTVAILLATASFAAPAFANGMDGPGDNGGFSIDIFGLGDGSPPPIQHPPRVRHHREPFTMLDGPDAGLHWGSDSMSVTEFRGACYRWADAAREEQARGHIKQAALISPESS